MDTARFLYRVRDERHQLAAAAFCGDHSRELGGLRVGFMPAYELLWCEGRPAVVTASDRASRRPTTALLPAAALGDAHELVRGLLRDAGLDSTRPVGVSRLDVTATLALDRPADGWAILRGMDALQVPRRKDAHYARDGRLQTVMKVTDRGVVRERIYDKGVELGDAPAGRRIRFEAQTRHPKATRTTVEHWTMERVRETFEHRFAPMARAADGLHVCSERSVRERLRELAESGAISPRQAELLMGHIAGQAVGLRQPRRTFFRRRAELRRLGLALALDGQEDVDVPLGDVLAEVVGAEGWRG